ncbi:MAG: hypothetical protein KTR31_23800 [Myxococcales bacterium]|nr:hypothetical protein [Myxococcales bacterium]
MRSLEIVLSVVVPYMVSCARSAPPTTAASAVHELDDATLTRQKMALVEMHDAGDRVRAEWMFRYDRFMWHASDAFVANADKAVKEHLGSEYFAVEQQDGPDLVVFGRFDAESDRYLLAGQVVYQEEGGFVWTDRTPEQAAMDRRARALARLRPTIESGFFGPAGANKYVWVEDDEVHVVGVPGFHGPGNVWFVGNALHMVFDADGRNQISEHRFSPGLGTIPADAEGTVSFRFPTDEDIPNLFTTFWLFTFNDLYERFFLVTPERALTAAHSEETGWLVLNVDTPHDDEAAETEGHRTTGPAR